MSDRDAYELLGLRANATPAEIRAAFRKKVRQHHPDTATGEVDDAALLEVIEAYRQLINRLAGAGHEPSPAGDESSSGRCSTCRGVGRVRSVANCPACDRRGEIISLDIGGARWVRCPTCQGRGQILGSHHPCPVCGGDQR